jgi:glucosyl-3-phosphoglycerate synthase
MVRSGLHCRHRMSDFFQHGLISTLHRLVDGPLIGRHESLPALESVVLVLPCHYAEIGTAALNGIVESLNKATFLSLIVVSMNGIPDLLTREVQLFWSKLQKSHVVLGNDSPNLLEQLARQGLPFNPGKGLNLWLAFGWLAANQSSGTVLVHDCDISNYNLDLPLTLALPVARLGYSFCKGYYSRVQQELFGRVTRLFVIPLVRSLVRVLGHMPLLDFIDSFRYPLSGEYSMSFDNAMNLPIESGWALEIGSLCDLHRNLDPKAICQVDLAMPFNHKHQNLDPAQPGRGLLRTASEIAGSLLTHLEREGTSFDGKTLESLVQTYKAVSNDFVRRYQDVANLNSLPFDLSRETGAAKAFSETLNVVCLDFLQGRRSGSLPPWRRMLQTKRTVELSIIAEA